MKLMKASTCVILLISTLWAFPTMAANSSTNSISAQKTKKNKLVAGKKHSHAAKKQISSTKKNPSSLKGIKSQPESKPLEQKMIFNDQMVGGKYQVPGEGLVTVENEKPLLNLISIRTDFKDRRAKEMQRN